LSRRGTRRASQRGMSSNDIHGIQPGWSLKTADDEDIGSVQ
jgi:hypothetical protein